MEKYMSDALIEANLALNNGEVPVGCVFVYCNQIIAKGGNLVNVTKNPTQHAEFVCIEQVLNYCKINNLNYKEIFLEISVVVTVEPCVMCLTILNELNVKEILYGCVNDRFGGTTILNVTKILNNHQIPIKGGYQADKAMNLLKIFYRGNNPSAPISTKKQKEK